MPILSIIIPVYNVEKYIDECLDSITRQTFNDMEIICINDGSTDSSAEILSKWQKKDSRIIVSQQINKGPSAARNNGIDIASGKYITFVDSDDILSLEMYSIMMEQAIKDNLDIIGCSFTTFPNGEIRNFALTTNKVTNCKTLISSSKELHSTNDLCYTWRYIIKKTILDNNNIVFNEKIKYGEDMIFMIDTIFNCNKILLIDNPLYFYRVNNKDSIMHKKYKADLDTALQLLVKEKKKLVEKYCIDKYTPFTKDMSEDIVKRYTQMLFNNLRNNPNEPDKIAGIKRILNMPMITDAMKHVGYRNIYTSWKEYIFFLAMKFKLANIVYKLYFK